MDIKSIFMLATEKSLFEKKGDFCEENIEQTFLNKIHPKQIINRMWPIPIAFYEVEYEYTTNKDNRKKGTKYFIYNTYSPEVNTEKDLYEWVKEFNKEYPERPLLNVKFLKSTSFGYITI